jgi:integrase
LLRKEVKINTHKGIRKILYWNKDSKSFEENKNGARFRVTKSIKGKRTTKCFKTLREAINWKNTYHPSLLNNGEILKEKDSSPFLKDVYENYIETIKETIEKSTLVNKLEKANLLKILFNYRMNEITPELIDELIKKRKELVIEKSPRRFNFDRELDEFRSVINWYIENHDYRYAKPLLKRHYHLGTIKKPKQKNKKMTPEEVTLFLNSIKENCNEIYYDLAVTQFYTAGRIQEVAGLQKQCVDLNKKVITIKYVAVWNKKKEFDYLKEIPKNNDVRYCKMTEAVFNSLTRRYNELSDECSFMFNKHGKPLSYRKIQYNYDKALKACGLGNKYSGTHFMRHSMASITRNLTGSIDYTQAVTGHKDIRYVQHYAGTPDSKQELAVVEVENFMNKISKEEEKCIHTQAHTDSKNKNKNLKNSDT